MRYFVTGATGFVGGAVARHLLNAGHQVVALARTPAKAAALAARGAHIAPGDITDKESMRAAMSGVDGVFHVAGWYKIGDRHKEQGWKINVEGARNVFELILELGIPKGVYTSTLAVNSDTHGVQVDETYRHRGPFLTEYERTKSAGRDLAEQMIARGLPLVIVLPGVIYGPGDTSIVRVHLVNYLRRRLPLVPQGTALSWIHIDDAAEGHLLAMQKGKIGESYLITGDPWPFMDVIGLGPRITGIPAPPSAPPWVFKGLAKIAGLAEKVLPLPSTYTAEGLRVIAGVTYIADDSKARRELGYTPRPADVGLTETVLHEMKLLGIKAPTSRPDKLA